TNSSKRRHDDAPVAVLHEGRPLKVRAKRSVFLRQHPLAAIEHRTEMRAQGEDDCRAFAEVSTGLRDVRGNRGGVVPVCFRMCGCEERPGCLADGGKLRLAGASLQWEASRFR